jgi:hypothetical protein
MAGGHNAATFAPAKSEQTASARAHSVAFGSSPQRCGSNKPGDAPLRRTFYFYVNDGISTRARFEVPFASDDQAIQHSKDLAGRLRLIRTRIEPGVVISVLNQAGREIHRELVDRTDEQTKAED